MICKSGHRFSDQIMLEGNLDLGWKPVVENRSEPG